MVAALVKGERIEIRDLDDLLEAVETSRRDGQSLVLLGEHEERLEVSPAEPLSPEEKQAKLLSLAGSWKGLVDTEELKRMIYESRGQRDRDWMIAESSSDDE